MAGDSEVSTKTLKYTISLPKVYEKDGLVWGWAGDCRPCELVRYDFKAPKRPAKAETAAYVVRDLMPALRKLFKEDGLETDSSSKVEWECLLGISGELWVLDSSGYLSDRVATGYAAAGSASMAALVGLALTESVSPRTRVTRVVEACCRHCVGVGGPVTVVRSP